MVLTGKVNYDMIAASKMALILGKKGQCMELVNFDSTRLNQLRHDTQFFQETMDMLASLTEKVDMPTRNYCINSEDTVVMHSDYFANASFSRG